MSLTVYLAGQIHDDWRGRLIEQASERGVDVNFVCPQDDHPLSDAIGVNVLGEESKARWKDELASCNIILDGVHTASHTPYMKCAFGFVFYNEALFCIDLIHR